MDILLSSIILQNGSYVIIGITPIFLVYKIGESITILHICRITLWKIPALIREFPDNSFSSYPMHIFYAYRMFNRKILYLFCLNEKGAFSTYSIGIATILLPTFFYPQFFQPGAYTPPIAFSAISRKCMTDLSHFPLTPC